MYILGFIHALYVIMSEIQYHTRPQGLIKIIPVLSFTQWPYHMFMLMLMHGTITNERFLYNTIIITTTMGVCTTLVYIYNNIIIRARYKVYLEIYRSVRVRKVSGRSFRFQQ